MLKPKCAIHRVSPLLHCAMFSMQTAKIVQRQLSTERRVSFILELTLNKKTQLSLTNRATRLVKVTKHGSIPYDRYGFLLVSIVTLSL